jgi:hypothetical protein
LFSVGLLYCSISNVIIVLVVFRRLMGIPGLRQSWQVREPGIEPRVTLFDKSARRGDTFCRNGTSSLAARS